MIASYGKAEGLMLLKPTDIVMNDITPVAKELPITFGHVKMQIFIGIYNMQISYPNRRILIALANIKACFWFARIHADLTGALGFLAYDLYNLATAMVFGSTTSASSWEPFRWAIKALTIVFTNSLDLVLKHKHLLDMIQWEDLDQTIDIVPAASCKINRGIIDKAGIPISSPAHIYVDNAIMLALNVEHMKMVLATMIKSTFIVMGEPEEDVRQCLLAMDKWKELVIRPQQTNGTNPGQVSCQSLEFTLLNLAHPQVLLQGIWSSKTDRWHVLPKVPTG
jgi:hypothetical protein